MQPMAPKIKGLRMLAVKSKKPLRKKMNTQVAATKYATCATERILPRVSPTLPDSPAMARPMELSMG